MNKHLKSFLHRGMLFGGFGPVVVGIVYLCLEHAMADFSLSGGQVCLAIVSSYLLAFVQAGVSVFNQIDEWSPMRSLLCHFSMLYLAYILCYLVNTWIPFRAEVILIFTAVFVALYLVIWLSVFLAVKNTGKRLNKSLR